MTRVLVCKVGEAPKVEFVEIPLEHAKYSLLDGGTVQLVYLDDGVIVCCDDNGQANRVGGDPGRSIPARAPMHDIADFHIHIGENAAPPGTMGVHQIFGNFLLMREATNETDEPLAVDLTDEDIAMYTALLALAPPTEAQRYLRTFFDEKSLRRPEMFSVTCDKFGSQAHMTYEDVITAVLQTTGDEASQIARTLRRIDFSNGDVHHFLRFLGEALVRTVRT